MIRDYNDGSSLLYIGGRGSRDKYPLNVKWGKREGLARAIRTRPPSPLVAPVSQHSPLGNYPYIHASKTPKNPVGKNVEKEHTVYVVVLHELPRQKPRVRNIRKTHSREKEYNPLNHQVEYSIIRIEILATSL